MTEITNISELIPDPKNPRKRGPRAEGLLVQSLHEVGAARSIVVDENGRILAGNGTVAAAAEAGIEKVQIVDTDGETIIAVRRRGLTEDQKQRLSLLDNRTGELAEWDLSVLQELKDDGLDLSGLWGDEELAELLADMNAATELLTDPDEIPTDVETRCKYGDLWKMGEHRLLAGDCTCPANVARLMDGAKAVCMWTDPPYGVSIVGGYRRLSEKERKAERPESATIAGDTRAELPSLLEGAFGRAAEALEDGAPWYCARPAGEHSFIFADAIRKLGWKLHQELQWVKGNMVLGHSDYHLKHETIMYGWIPGPGRSGRGNHEGSRWYGDNSQTSVMEIPLGESPDHPSMKPIALLVQHLRNSSPPKGLVYDPFLGSGSTLIACEQLGRRCVGLEIDPKYCDVILQRWENATGKQAELIEHGRV